MFVGVKTFERPEQLDNLLRSLAQHCPGIPVVVADDSSQPREGTDSRWPTVSYLPLPHDVGLSAGRNALLDAAPERVMVLMDDDFEATARTDLGALAAKLDEVDICGALLTQGGRDQHCEDRLWIAGRQICRQRVAPAPFLRCDMVFNAFACDVEAVQKVRWRDELKLGEHLDFFLRAKGLAAPWESSGWPLRVGWTSACAIEHRPMKVGPYASHRLPKQRAGNARFLEIWGCDGVTRVDHG